MKKILYLILLTVTTFTANSQSISNYSFAAGNSLFTPLSGATTPTRTSGSANEGWYTALPLGFDFWYMGVKYTTITASTNGWLSFGASTSSAAAGNTLSTFVSGVSRPLIAPLWDDLDMTSGSFSYMTTGFAPNRVFVAQWLNAEWDWMANTPVISFQAKLYESSGIIEFHYRSEAGNVNSGSASIGITAVNVAPGMFLSVQDSAGSTIASSTTNFTNINSKPLTGTTYSFTPPTPLAPTALTFTSVGNTTMTLNWTDNATNEFGYLIYRSTNGVDYDFVSQVAANTTSSIQSGLSSGTAYYWNVYALTEGGFSPPLNGFQSTTGTGMNGTFAIPGNYATITAALAAIVTTGINGPIILELQSTYTSASETFPITIGSSLGSSVNNPITIRPAANATNLTIAGTLTAALIQINNAKYITFDGRPGGVGNVSELTIQNNNTTGSNGMVFQLNNDASYNNIRYCKLKTNQVTSGIVAISTTTLVTGCDYNVVEYNSFSDAGITTPITMINMNGTTNKENNFNIIRNNRFFNCFGTSSSSTLITIFQSSGTIITGNSFYQTQSLTAQAFGHTMTIININSGSGYEISDNYFGGTDTFCMGSPLTIGPVTANNRYVGIQMNGINGSGITPSIIRGNQFNNFFWAGSSNISTSPGVWCAIIVNAGTYIIRDNLIGKTTGTGITVYSEFAATTTAPNVYGIICNNTFDVSLIKNTIAGITTMGGANNHAIGITGILTQNVTTLLADSNTIGGPNYLSGLVCSNAVTTGSQQVQGIQVSSGTNATLSNNIIRNLHNSIQANIAAMGLRGITATATAQLNIQNNQIRSCYTSTQNNGSGSNAAVIGIQTTATAPSLLISGNYISQIGNNNAGANTQTIGINVAAVSTGTAIIERNFIAGLFTNNTGFSANLTGINLLTGASEVRNNMIRLGIDSAGNSIIEPIQIYGINKSTVENTSIFNNTLFIGGAGIGSGSAHTFALRRTSDGNDVLMNNVLVNNRSNATTGARHGALSLNSLNGISSNANCFYGTGNGRTIGMIGTFSYDSIMQWRNATLLDNVSGFVNPNLVNPTGSESTVDLHISSSGVTPIEGNGINLVSVTTDFDGEARSALTPVDIGADAGNFTSIPLPLEWGAIKVNWLSNKQASALLSWETLSELNNQMFEIEHASDNSVYTKIGETKGALNASTPRSYQWVHQLTPEEQKVQTHHYRIKQIDVDGMSSYSNVVTLKANSGFNLQPVISPNPVFSNASAVIAPLADIAEVSVLGIDGKMYFSWSNVKGENQLELPSLHQGIYLVQLKDKFGNLSGSKLLVQ